jgi:hypothetical protein
VRQLPVEFAPQRQTGKWVWACIALAALAVAGIQADKAIDLRALFQAEASRANELAAQLAAARQAVLPIKIAAPPPYAADARALANLASFDWGRVLTAVESVQMAGVRVLAIEISASEQQAKVELELSDAGALPKYLEAINAGEPKARWTLVQTQLGASGSTTSATIQSRWADFDR